MTFATHLERRFMQRLRGAGWVNASALPPSQRLVQTLLQKGWIETTKSGPKNVVLYRLTEVGLNAKKLPIPIPQRRRPYSKGKISDQSRRGWLSRGRGTKSPGRCGALIAEVSGEKWVKTLAGKALGGVKAVRLALVVLTRPRST